MRKIYGKLFSTYALVILICLGLVGTISSLSLKNFYQNRIARELETNALLVKNILKENKDPQLIQSTVLDLNRQIGARITVIDSEGIVLTDSDEDPAKMENHKNRPEIKTALLSKRTGQSIRFSETIKIDMMYIAIPVVKNDEVSQVIRLSLPLVEVKEKMASIHKIIIYSILIGGLVSIGLGALVGRHFSSPLSEMNSFAQKIIQGDFSKKVRIRTKDEVGQLAKSLNEMSDQLEQKIRAIIKDKNEMEAILGSMQEGVIVIDKDENTILLNSSLTSMLELRSEEFTGRPFWEIISDDEINSILKQALEKKDSFSSQVFILKREPRNIQIQTAPITDQHEKLFGIVGVFHDITDLKKLEKARSEFLANVSHELITPITSIVGSVETLKDGAINIPNKRDDFLDIIYSHSQRLANLVNDILSLTQIEAHEIKMSFQPVIIKEIIDDIWALYKNKAESEKLSFEIDIPSKLPHVSADPEWITLAFSNLVDNAIKFTKPKDQIKVRAEEINNFVRIDVSDTGIGISEEHLPRIFERFYRVDKARSREMGGTGLGLAIVKHIVQANQGKITVKSKPGKGSTFSVVLPKAA
ncbi:MAG: PAS domain-containing protein [Candidatus Aminicenantes bacterium]|nr:PAS domain-containing protein [Candidatus Aminicenantes bacterium]